MRVVVVEKKAKEAEEKAKEAEKKAKGAKEKIDEAKKEEEQEGATKFQSVNPGNIVSNRANNLPDERPESSRTDVDVDVIPQDELYGLGDNNDVATSRTDVDVDVIPQDDEDDDDLGDDNDVATSRVQQNMGGSRKFSFKNKKKKGGRRKRGRHGYSLKRKGSKKKSRRDSRRK